MDRKLPIETTIATLDENIIQWPENMPKDAYTLVYSHSSLQLNKHDVPLKANQLYEAWAFDGKKSWHLWKQGNEWVFTTYDTEMDKENEFIIREQMLANQFKHSMKKSKLLVYERIAYDEDNQAYIAYSCPINVK